MGSSSPSGGSTPRALFAALALVLVAAVVLTAANFMTLRVRGASQQLQQGGSLGAKAGLPLVPHGARELSQAPPQEHPATTPPRLPLLCTNNTHFDLSEDVMPPAFREHLQYNVRSIRGRWSRNAAWAKYSAADVSSCATDTPECALYRCLGGGGTSATPAETDAEGFQSDDRPYRKCCVEHKKLRDTARWVMQVLDEAGVRYFLSTGSALGAVRHGGTIIPWDTDVDIAIFPADKDKVEALFTARKAEHFFHVDRLGKSMFWVHASRNGKPRDGPHVEIFYEADYTSKPDKLLPLQRCDLYGTATAWCPKADMFTEWFGDWHVYGGCHYHHGGRVTMYEKGKRVEKSKC